jgi:N-formylglutamate deformylase
MNQPSQRIPDYVARPDSEQAWAVCRFGQGSVPLLVHVPHAGTLIPPEERARLLLDDSGLALELRRMTDWHTDRLAVDALQLAGVAGAVFINRVSRLVVDPERLTDDVEPMAAIGMGRVYRVTSQLRPLRHADPADDQGLLDRWFHPYAAAFGQLVDETLYEHGRVTIVDLHSFPSEPLPYEPDPLAPRPGICIGTDPDHTPPALVASVFKVFARTKGNVARNTPFSGAYVPLRHWRHTREVTSIMVEVRRDLYLQEPGGPLHEGFETIVAGLARFFTALTAGSPGPGDRTKDMKQSSAPSRLMSDRRVPGSGVAPPGTIR